MPKKKEKRPSGTWAGTGYVGIVHEGKRFLFTEKEYNNAWLRSRKRSGLD